MISKMIISLMAFIGLVMAQSPTPSPTPTPSQPVVVAPSGYVAGPVAGTFIPTLPTLLQNVVTSMENESVLSLVGEGITSTQAAILNLDLWANDYCTGVGASAPGCSTITQTLVPYTTQLQTAFALVPASQWNPATFTATGMPVNAIGFVLLAQQQAPTPTPTPIPQLVVNTAACVFITGVNGPSGTECPPAQGVPVSSLTNGAYVSQGGVLYLTVKVQGLMGASAFFEPVQ